MPVLGPRGNALVLRLLVLAALVAPHVAVWQVRHLPTQDGPLHVYNATLPIVWPNAGAADTAATHPRIAEYLETRPTLASWLPQRMLGLALRVAGIDAGERLFVSLYLLAFAAAAWFVLTGFRRENGFLVVLIAPLATNHPLGMGFYPFCTSLPLTLLAAGLWMRPNYRHPARLALLAVVLTVATLSHPFGLVVAGLLMLVVSLYRIGAAAAGDRWRDAWRDLAPLALAAVPGLVVFAGSMEAGKQGLAYVIPGPGRILERLTSVPDWVAYSRLEWLPLALGVGVPVAVAVAAAAARWRSRIVEAADALLLAALALAGLYVALPDTMASGSYIGSRMFLWSAIAAALWAASVPHPPARRAALTGLSAASALALAIILGQQYRTLDVLLEEHASATRIVPPHSTLLTLSIADTGATPDTGLPIRVVAPFLHAAGVLGAGRDIVLLSNYQAERTHFPVKFRPAAVVFDADVVDHFPRDPLDWPMTASGPAADYVLIWGPIDRARFPGNNLSSALATLGRDYQLVHVSRPRGLARLWRRR